ncbi:MAG: hypothetical protein IPM51_10890 [Sphingobacteriaceae bacterium]|nr:hypothetical protein [Sphingobacteriaceae bacterium]
MIKSIVLGVSTVLIFSSCRKERVCRCISVSASTTVTTESSLGSKYTKAKAKKECNKLDGTYITGVNLEETKINCELSQ